MLLKEWKELGRISAASYEKLSLFVDLILEWNVRINLTGFKSRDRVEEVLIGESLQALDLLAISGKRVLDFGSGAGIPGLVWSMCDPKARVTSLEIRQKKVAFQKEVARVTGLSVEIQAGHFPEAAAGRSFDLIVSRAIRLSPSVWKEGEKLLTQGGSILRFAVPDAEEQGWKRIPLSSRTTLLVRTV